MDVLLVGGTGFVGTELAALLENRGHSVTALSRTAESEPLPDGVRPRNGDVTEYDSIADAFAGMDAVVNLVALSPLFTPPGGDSMHETVHLGGTENVVAAMEAHDVPRLVQVSALGADPDGPTAYVRAKGRAEQVVRDTEVAATVVRPSVVFGDGGEFVPFTKTLTTPYVTGLPGGGDTRFQPLWVGDLARMLADAVEDDAHAGETYELGGPEVLTLADVTELAYHAEDTPVAILPVPMPLAKVGLTVGGKLPGFPMGPDQYRSLQFDNTVTDDDVAAFGIEPDDLRTLADYLSAPAEPSTNARSAFAARSTLFLFGFLTLSAAAPFVLDPSFAGGLARILSAPAYLLAGGFYAAMDPLEPFLGSPDGLPNRALWIGGPLLTYYLASVAVTWIGRQLAAVGRPPADTPSTDSSE